jgi:hypothetical protein
VPLQTQAPWFLSFATVTKISTNDTKTGSILRLYSFASLLVVLWTGALPNPRC